MEADEKITWVDTEERRSTFLSPSPSHFPKEFLISFIIYVGAS